MTFDVGQRLRQVRRQAGLTQRQLAERGAVPHGQIAMIERNRSSPSVASLRKILGGIPMDLSDFFEPDRVASDSVFFAAEELIDLTSRLHAARGGVNGGGVNGGGVNGGSVAAGEVGAASDPGPEAGTIVLRQIGDARRYNLQMLQERYEPGADTGEAMLEHLSHEAGIVVSGEVEVTVGAETRVLKAGDAYIFDSRQPHRFRNIGEQPAEIISACTPPYL